MDTIYKDINILILESDIELEKAYSNLCFANTMIFIESEQNDSTISKIISAFKAFISKCIENIKNIYYKLKEKLNEFIIQRKLNNLANFSKMVDAAKKSGKTSFECIDIDKIISLLKEESKFYKSSINKFSYNYINGKQTPDKAEKDIKNIEMQMEKYSEKLNELLNSPRIYNINEAERIISKLTKDKEYIEILNNYTKEIKDVERYTINVMKSINEYREENGLNNLNKIQSIIAKSIIYMRDHSLSIVTNVINFMTILPFLKDFVSTQVQIFNTGLSGGSEKEIKQAGIDGITNMVDRLNPLNSSPIEAVGSVSVTALNVANIVNNKKKKKQRIDQIDKIYQSPSLKFK